MKVFEELKRRGMIAQTTDENAIRKLLDEGQVTFYIGFDPTADSLHVGHMLQLVIMSRLQRAGHRPIAILGVGTAMVGDPSGRTDMRKMLTQEDIRYNASRFRCQMQRLVDFSDGKALMVDNSQWLLSLNYVQFLREIGVHFSVNRMLAAECFKSRMERGLSFIEFNYMLMQSYDFLKLFQEYGCVMQLGGDDQWSNILYGIELIRRVEGKEAYGMTFTLLTTSDGKKMGKTQSGAVWLDPEKTPPYEFYQYWRNVADSDVIRCLKLLTFVPIEEIEDMESLQGSELNRAKELLAYEVTALVHGEDEAKKAEQTARSLFAKRAEAADMPSCTLPEGSLTDDGIAAVDLLVLSGMAPSKSEARRLIVQGGVSVDETRLSDAACSVPLSSFDKGYVVVKKGKKVFLKVHGVKP